MVTANELRVDLEKLDAMMKSFEDSYLHFIDYGEDDRRNRNRGVSCFYAIWDLYDKLLKDAEELCGHMEVCSVILALNKSLKGGAVDA